VQTKANVALASAQLEAARAQAKLAGVNVDNHVLTAPFRGLVVRAPTAPGAIVPPGVPMFRVEDTSTLQLDATLGAEEAALVSPGSPVEVEINGRKLEAKLTLVLDTLDQLTRRVAVAAELTNDVKDPVRPGAFVRARIRGLRPVEVLRLPASALRPGSQDVVMVADGDKLRERRVVFSLSQDGELLVRRGLTLADRVVRAPAAESADGDPIILPLETK
jgi:RND family efflux transporter MFP subunit